MQKCLPIVLVQWGIQPCTGEIEERQCGDRGSIDKALSPGTRRHYILASATQRMFDEGTDNLEIA